MTIAAAHPPMTELVVDEGAAIACCEGIVLGYWYAPFNEHRLRLCSDAYHRVAERFGAFSVFTVFRVNPYTLSSLLSSDLRVGTVNMLDTHADRTARIVCVLEGSPLMVAAMRASAAATTHFVKRAAVLSFVTTADDGLAQLHDVPGAVPADVLREHVATLELAAARSAPRGTFPRIERPSWAHPL
jgi:hypothetical protein